jgi:hypothetical protein
MRHSLRRTVRKRRKSTANFDNPAARDAMRHVGVPPLAISVLLAAPTEDTLPSEQISTLLADQAQ